MPSTIRTQIAKPVSSSNKDACLVYIYPPGPEMGRRIPLDNRPLLVGRDPDCDICLQDSAVSRKHMQIVIGTDKYVLEDLASTNGTFINDSPIKRATLNDGDYVRIGSSIYRFLSGGNVEADYHQVIYELTIQDALTEIYNKRFLMDFVDRELVRSQRHKRPLSVVMFDIDHFKRINDQYGHLCGDYALRELANCVKKQVRKDELFARYGGEEFTIVLPETDATGATLFAERLRKMVAELNLEYENDRFRITISLGLATSKGDENLLPEELIRRADAKLYEAKKAGRNRLAT